MFLLLFRPVSGVFPAFYRNDSGIRPEKKRKHLPEKERNLLSFSLPGPPGWNDSSVIYDEHLVTQPRLRNCSGLSLLTPQIKLLDQPLVFALFLGKPFKDNNKKINIPLGDNIECFDFLKFKNNSLNLSGKARFGPSSMFFFDKPFLN